MSGTASADAVCRTTEDANNAVLHLYGFTPPASGSVTYWIGNFDFFGSSAVGACVTTSFNGASTLYLLVDNNNNLLGWLPKIWNHMCLTSRPDDTIVVQTPTNVCGVTMSPLNYNGNILMQYGQASADIIRGGNGLDVIAGGTGNDSIVDYTAVGANNIYYGELYGESGNDILGGSPASNTFLNGGDQNDHLRDFGGVGEVLVGGAGNECCIWDSNNSYNAIDCGTGTDTVNTLAGSPAKQNCDVVSGSCGNTGFFCP